jgi:hypothetical protein
MAERRRRRLAVVGIAMAALVAAAAVFLGAKVLDEDDREAADPCQARGTAPAPAAELALMPAGLSFDEVGTVTRVQRNDQQISVQAVTTKPLDEVTVLIQEAVTAAGYRPAGMDNEGFEAEVFFNSGSYAAGQARVRQFGCEGRWDIDLVLLDLAAAGSTTTGGS